MLKKLNKKNKILLISALCLVLVVVLTIFFTGDKNPLVYKENIEGKEIKNEFEKLNNEISEDGKEFPEVKIPENNILNYTTITDILNLINNNGDAVVYFGYPSCVYCRNAIQVLMDTAKDTELDVIYYLDVDTTDTKYTELVEILGDNLTIEEDGKRKIYMPLVVFITDGKIISYNKGTLSSQEDPYKELDNSQVEGLSIIYKYGINDVVSSQKRKNK